MNRLLVLFACALFIPAWGMEVVKEWTWAELQSTGDLAVGEIAGNVFVPAATAGTTISVATLHGSGLSRWYALWGTVRYTGVEPQGHLEMWTIQANGSRFFSRTLGRGRTAPLSGDSEWREFVLPAERASIPVVLDGAGERERLLLNVVLPGEGTVQLGGPLRLVRFDTDGEAMQFVSEGAGISGALLGVAEGMLGAIIGLLGAAIGILAGMGRARTLVYALLGLMGLLGVGMVTASLVLVSLPGAGAGFVSFLIGGLISLVLAVGLFPVIRNRYRADEWRRMQAMDC